METEQGDGVPAPAEALSSPTPTPAPLDLTRSELERLADKVYRLMLAQTRLARVRGQRIGRGRG